MAPKSTPKRSKRDIKHIIKYNTKYIPQFIDLGPQNGPQNRAKIDPGDGRDMTLIFLASKVAPGALPEAQKSSPEPSQRPKTRENACFFGENIANTRDNMRFLVLRLQFYR